VSDAGDAGSIRVLTWNLFHGRSLPPSGRQLVAEFGALLAAADWDVALLQEVPPWWPERLARAAGAQACAALTSRNAALALRRAIAERAPDLIKSNGGGANAVLSRRPIAEHRAVRLRTWPERRVVQLVRLRDGITLANHHGSTRVHLAEDELNRLWTLALAFAGKGPLILGGDLNLRRPAAPEPAIVHVASRDVDHMFARGLDPQAPGEPLERRATVEGSSVELSDHPPLAATLLAAPAS
jgi:endonuclease/exonuclease/phosphatase family metal-dependent hydrolase